jgi:hypothetical protein
MAEPQIQLWTDDSSSEFAIFLNSNYVIRTNQEVNYTKMVDESVCLQGFNYDWKHTLSQWVSYIFGNQLSLPENVDISSSQQVSKYGTKVESKLERIKIPAQRTLHKKSSKRPILKPKQKSKAKLLKCNFCNLRFCIIEERDEHEKFWHSDKITPT